MRTRTIGKTDIEASVVAIGAWAIGGGTWWGPTDDEVSIRAIHAGIDAGITLIDTAPVYGFGRSEEVVGKALKGRRDKVVLATKCGLWWHDDSGVLFFELEGHTVRKSLLPKTITQEVEMSLKRLQTDYIDLYQTHWQSPEPENDPIADTMECLLKLKDEGKIRAIGASNVDIPQIQAYQAVGQLDAIQPRYSMLDRKIEQDLLPYCLEQQISTLAYSPLEQGLLTGKIGMDRTFEEGRTRNRIAWFKPENRRKVLDMLNGWNDLTEKYHCTTSQLVIAWTIDQPGVTFPLCGARKPEHTVENAAAGDILLESQDRERMRQDVEALGEPQ
ncbi:aldo/keto reductase [candidate division KSB3 bacterium]|uniref:Aldo/keto reductase n=1 Tax=candidate division KSB3 bacterium TaxID=2044937 RepID=A0A9D5JUG8_9BACT|nr:aldo/keto reductase [candidate division KSB3 bacterium]MBD3324231.1 aldo/keto reductase [candidate division KSB3 bacterium]